MLSLCDLVGGGGGLPRVAYWVYGVMGLLAALFIWRFVPETKGRTLEEMEGYWKR